MAPTALPVAARTPKSAIGSENKLLVTGSSKKPRHHHGFTLLEILVVLLIIGLVAAMASQNFSGRTAISQSQQTAERLANVLTLAVEEAMLWQVAIGMRLTPQGYDFAIFDESKQQWQQITHDPELGEMQLGAHLSLQLQQGIAPVLAKADTYVPEIVVNAAGGIAPFVVTVKFLDKPYAKVYSAADGNINAQRLPTS